MCCSLGEGERPAACQPTARRATRKRPLTSAIDAPQSAPHANILVEHGGVSINLWCAALRRALRRCLAVCCCGRSSSVAERADGCSGLDGAAPPCCGARRDDVSTCLAASTIMPAPSTAGHSPDASAVRKHPFRNHNLPCTVASSSSTLLGCPLDEGLSGVARRGASGSRRHRVSSTLCVH